MPKRRTLVAEVFLNIPYDQKFERLFLAYICGISAFGLVPRATLEITTSARRLDRIFDLIRACRYSVHDLSWVKLDRVAPRTPRFNMPFELGLAIAYERMSAAGDHEWFVFESDKFRLAKSLSDVNGTDPWIHQGTIAGVFRELRSMFNRPGGQPSIQEMWSIYRTVRRQLPLILYQAGTQSLYTARVFKDISVVASRTADRIM